MQYHTKTQRFTISEKEPYKNGAEGKVYSKGSMVVKLLHKPYREVYDKLAYLIAHRPSAQRERLTAWPQEIVYDRSNRFCGYTMKKIEGRPLSEVMELFVEKWDKSYLMYFALSLIRCVDNIHAMRFCIGDFNPNNFIIDIKTGDIIRIDIDSLHIATLTTYFPCQTLHPEYSMPEILKQMQAHGIQEPGKLPKRCSYTRQADWFALYTMVFRLLNRGIHPCHAQPTKKGEAVPLDLMCIQQGIRPYFVPHADYKLPEWAPPLTFMPIPVRALFQQCFGRGWDHPNERPSAKKLYMAIEQWYNSVRKRA